MINPSSNPRLKAGYSLVELMAVLIIIGILAGIVYPSYTQYIQKSRRSDAHVGLLRLGVLMEHYYTENNSYSDATLTKVGSAEQTPEGYYTLTISELTDTSYTLTATPVPEKSQAQDRCGNLTLTHTNVKGPSLDCW